ncbi:NAD(P)-binding protein [Leucogyrophana mollusca]|uniref:NAD(P)-binding protein n=1 Tax=Leucogyrophana mollusca TaxID=85980 RepID=A0ACB8BUR4_9AGAM|nr:NAD(P)-binding protein [Leucogyrophana mollusca]
MTFFRMLSTKEGWNPRGLHVYITGGSQGLGLALAVLVAKKGAHVSIVARTQSELEKALIELEVCGTTSSGKRLGSTKAPCLSPTLRRFVGLPTRNSDRMPLLWILNIRLLLHSKLPAKFHGGRVPDAVFACAGGWRPMFFPDREERVLTHEVMVDCHCVQAFTACAAAERMARERKKGKIILVSSSLGFLTSVGSWSSDYPINNDLCLAGSLRAELMVCGIDTYNVFPPSMHTPGLDKEHKMKPAVTRKIESADEGLTAEQAASALLKGLNGEPLITGGMIMDPFRAAARSYAARTNHATRPLRENCTDGIGG